MTTSIGGVDISINNENLMHFFNNTKEEVIIIVSPNKDWLIGDLGFDIGKMVLSGGINAGKLLNYPKQLKNLSDLWNLVDYVKKVYGLTQISKLKKLVKIADADAAARKQFEQVRKLVVDSGIRLKPGETRVVSVKDVLGSAFRVMGYLAAAGAITNGHHALAQKTLAELQKTDRGAQINKDKEGLTKKARELGFSDFIDSATGMMNILNPSTFMSMLGFMADMRVMVVDDKLERSAIFKSNSNHSWIVNDNEIVRSKENELHTPARDKGHKPFVRVKGDFLLPGEYLEPNDALMIETSSSNINTDWEYTPQVEEKTGNLLEDLLNGLKQALRRRTEAQARMRMNLAKNTVGKVLDILLEWQYLLIYQNDGNLVLYENNGSAPAAIWSTNTMGRGAWRVYMQDDGNLCIYSREGKCEWALWRQPPASAKDGHIALTQNGKLGFYCKDAKTMGFELKDKKETFRAEAVSI